MYLSSLFLMILSNYIFPVSAGYLSYGDGTDVCNWTTNQTLTKAVWNCDSLTIGSGVVIKFDLTQVSAPVQFRVQGTTNIAGTIDISATTE